MEGKCEEKRELSDEGGNGLQMAPELMLDLAHKAAELLVERIQDLPEGEAWDGEFRQGLEKQLMKDPPEDGRSPAEVIEQVAREILPVAMRLDHPRCFAFIPSSPTWPGVLADFMAAGYNINACTWLVGSGPSQLELVVIDWLRQWVGYPESAGGLFTSGGSAASLDAFVAAREVADHPECATVYMSDQSHSALIRAARIIGIRHRVHTPDTERRPLPPGHGCTRTGCSRRLRRGIQPHCCVRQRRNEQYRDYRSNRSHGRLL